jgi:hypothetical protein
METQPDEAEKESNLEETLPAVPSDSMDEDDEEKTNDGDPKPAPLPSTPTYNANSPFQFGIGSFDFSLSTPVSSATPESTQIIHDQNAFVTPAKPAGKGRKNGKGGNKTPIPVPSAATETPGPQKRKESPSRAQDQAIKESKTAEPLDVTPPVSPKTVKPKGGKNQ